MTVELTRVDPFFFVIGGEFRADQVRIWSSLAEMAIWLALVIKGYRVY